MMPGFVKIARALYNRDVSLTSADLTLTVDANASAILTLVMGDERTRELCFELALPALAAIARGLQRQAEEEKENVCK